ncbi:FtsX-like permease family protein [Cellulomonas sp. IC4_254]|uniref:FtsX-like permease family protein n=1 Tax=Cellulomonas sp. IC4_254 TaxID=2714040 RepID=UPI00141E8458|nr:FtsX-like permease family protein [Cellulomonas sp. IC4_254]NHT18048.1 hypothetical protein [Cellulomonas sp. IC4_254]
MWRPDELLVEARRNLGPAHAVLGVLSALVSAAVVTLLLLQGGAALHQESARRAAGALVWTATASEPSVPLDGAACTRLTGLPGVAVSGGVAAEPPTELRAFPGGSPLPVTGLTGGAAQVFVPSAPWAAATVGAELAALGEVGRGSWLVDAAGSRAVQVTEVLDAAPVSALSSGLTVPVTSDAPLSACWVRMDPGAAPHGGDVLVGAFPDGVASVSPYLRDQEGVLTPVERWRSTVHLQPWAVGGAVIAATALLALWARRTELAVYRTFGTPRSVVVALAAVELIFVLVPAAAAGVLLGAAACAVVTGAGAPWDLAGTAVAQAAAAASTGVLLTVLLAPLTVRQRLTDTLRDR